MINTGEIGVIGLGKFGLALANTLMDMGHTVIGVDKDPELVRKAQNSMTQVYEADATDEKALEQLGFRDLEIVIVSTGSSMEASILVALNLQALEVNKIWVKAMSEEHERVLYKLGVPYVIFPEVFVAFQLALRLTTKGIHEYFGLGTDVLTREVEIKKWTGKSLQDLELTKKFHVRVLAHRPLKAVQFNFVPNTEEKLKTGDTLVLLGETKNVMKIKTT